MRGYFGIGALVLAWLGMSACAEPNFGQSADDSTGAVVSAPCDATIDAAGFTCGDGRTFSVRHDLNDVCVVVFIDEETYALPYDAERAIFTNGTVTFGQRGSIATLTGATSVPLENCAMVGE